MAIVGIARRLAGVVMTIPLTMAAKSFVTVGPATPHGWWGKQIEGPAPQMGVVESRTLFLRQLCVMSRRAASCLTAGRWVPQRA